MREGVADGPEGRRLEGAQVVVAMFCGQGQQGLTEVLQLCYDGGRKSF
jgi:hypothetical protein